MPRARRAALLGGGVSAYVDLNFAAAKFKAGTSSAGDLTALPGFTFTRASLAMGYDATGKLTYAPNNLLLQSQTFGTTWTQTSVTVGTDVTTAPDGTATADSLIETAATAVNHRITQSVTTMGAPAVYSVYLKAGSRTWAFLRLTNSAAGNCFAWVNLSTGALGTVSGTGASATVTSAGNGWYRLALAMATTTNGANTLVIAGSTGDGIQDYDGTNGLTAIYGWGAQLEAVTYQTTPGTYYPTTSAAYYGPRLVYDPVTLASLGILVEEARTNLCLQSSNFATTWSTAGTVTTDATTSPDGTTNADLVTSGGSITLVQNIVLAATSCTYSVYAKKSTGATHANLFYLRNATTATDLLGINFNYDTGAIGYAVGSSGATATNVGNGWWRIVLTVSSGITSGNTMSIYAGFAGGSTTGQAAYFWGAQLEAGTGASSPIPTTTASVTRAADVAAVTGLAPTFPMSMVWEWRRNWGAGGTQAVSTVDSGSAAQRVITYIGSGDNVQISMDGGANAGFVTDAGTVGVNTTYKHAARMALNYMNMALGGVLATPDTTADYPTSTVSNLRIGTNTGGALQLNGTISRIRIYNRALSDAQLQSLTS